MSNAWVTCLIPVSYTHLDVYKRQVQYPPTEGKYRVYIIDEVHMLSTGAFNALLKTCLLYTSSTSGR